MLDDGLKSQLKTYLERIVRPVALVTKLDTRPVSADMRKLLKEIAALSDRISFSEQRHQNGRTPSFSIAAPGHNIHLAFAGLPMGHQFSSLVLALLQVGGHPPKEEELLLERAKSLKGMFRFETYFAQDCRSCPDTVQALNLLAILNANVEHMAIDGALFPGEVEQRQVQMVPKIYLNGELFGSGRMSLRDILDTAARHASP